MQDHRFGEPPSPPASPLRLGTSSWTYPGWAGLMWDGAYPETLLSKKGLRAYGQHSPWRAWGTRWARWCSS
jgi:hypothetical protein